MLSPTDSRRVAKAIQSGIELDQREELVAAAKTASSLEEMPDWVQKLVQESEKSDGPERV